MHNLISGKRLLGIIASILAFIILFLIIKELRRCDDLFKPPVYVEKLTGPTREIIRSKLPILYYYNKVLPSYTTINIKQALLFHEKIYFVSKDLKVDIPGVVNVLDDEELPESVQCKLAKIPDPKTRLSHLSDFKRVNPHSTVKEDYIYADLDEVVLKPTYECGFATLVRDEAYYGEIAASWFCLNSTIRNYIHEKQVREYNPFCWNCVGPGTFTQLVYENVWDIRMELAIGDVTGNYEMLHREPLLNHISTHIHIYRNRTIENLEYQNTLSLSNPNWKARRTRVCSLQSEGAAGRRIRD